MTHTNPTRPRLTVIGTGYLGATHAACMAELGFEVLGLDVDPEKVAALQAARVPFYEPGLEELIAKQVAAGRLRFTTSVEEVAEFGDVHFLCVGTPQKRGEFAADLRHVDAALDALAPHLRRPCLVAGKSTVPVGTAPASPSASSRSRPRAPTSSWPGTRSSCGRASPSTTRCARTAWSSVSPPTTPRRCCGPSTHRCSTWACR
jgi:UDP-N-acetyl-D-mannosaminuronate dehydrogenase